MKFGTKAIHAGVKPDPTTGAIMTPIYQTSTYVQEAPGVNKGFGYARGKNPTREALQESIAALENGNYCVCFSSGVAATDAVLKLLSPGDEVITTPFTFVATAEVIRLLGLVPVFVDVEENSFNLDPAKVEAAKTN